MGEDMEDYIIRKANIDDVKPIVKFIDSTFTKEGYGFVTSAQINTEVKRGAAWVAVIDAIIIGVRVGIAKVYNLTVHPKYRKQGIGKELILISVPKIIRVKSTPVGHLSKLQIKSFANPEHFYESLGYHLLKYDFARNFYQKGKNGEPAHFHKVGKKAHIKIYVQTNPDRDGELNFED